MARAIIRYSIQSGQIRLRNQVRNALMDAGFQRIGTATFETVDDLDLAEAIRAAAEAMLRLAGSRLDNLWVYIDQPGRYIE